MKQHVAVSSSHPSHFCLFSFYLQRIYRKVATFLRWIQPQRLKGTVSRDFLYPVFFHLSAPPGPIRDVQGLFWFFLLFYGIIGLLKWLPGAWDTREWTLNSLSFLRDNFLNECCFKGSSVGLKVHTNSKTTSWCLGHRWVATPRYLGKFWIFSGSNLQLPGVPSTRESF